MDWQLSIEDPRSECDGEFAFLVLLLRNAEVRVRAEGDDEERSNFFLAAGKYFNASWGEMESIRSAGISVEEIPVVLHVSRHAAITSGEVVDLRAAGVQWLDIMSRFSMRPETLRVPLATSAGSRSPRLFWCYGRSAGGGWKKHGETDQDIINLVNLKFAAEHYRLEPEKIIALHATGWSFVSIHAAVPRPEPVSDLSPVSTSSMYG